MIDVVIPYCDDSERLESILLALAAQVDPTTGDLLDALSIADALSITVADDASDVAPDTSMSRHRVQVVRLDQPGYHAAGARNAGAAAGRSPVIVFLDGDTVPSPTCVAGLVSPIRSGAVDVTTGHRSHADFTGLDPAEVARFVASPSDDRLLPEPEWLRRGLEWTDRLQIGTSQVYQYVISAAMAVRRELFDHVGGFDDRFDSYGGEDWELAYRCWDAGAEFRQVDDAIAFHDGPDIEGRTLDPYAKTVESLRIADLVPASATRLPGVLYAVPDVEVELHLRAGDPVANATCVASLLAGDPGDLRVHVAGPARDVDVVLGHMSDPRVVRLDDRPRPPARCVVTVPAPVEFTRTSLDAMTSDVRDGTLAERRVGVGTTLITVRSRRLHGPFSRSMRRHGTGQRTGSGSTPVVTTGAGYGLAECPATDLANWLRARAAPTR